MYYYLHLCLYISTLQYSDSIPLCVHVESQLYYHWRYHHHGTHSSPIFLSLPVSSVVSCRVVLQLTSVNVQALPSVHLDHRRPSKECATSKKCPNLE